MYKTQRQLILHHLNRLKDLTSTTERKVRDKIITQTYDIDFEITENNIGITIDIPKTIKYFWQVYWHLNYSDALNELKQALKQNGIVYALYSGQYVPVKGGCFITIMCDPHETMW